MDRGTCGVLSALLMVIAGCGKKPTAREAVAVSVSERSLRLGLQHDGVVRDVGASSDGEYLFSAGDDGYFRMWAVSDLGKPVFALGEVGASGHICLSRDSKRALLTTRLLRLVAGRCAHLLVEVSLDNGGQVWTELPTTGSPISSYYMDGESKLLCFSASNVVLICEQRSGALVRSAKVFGGFIHATAASPDRRHFAVISQNEIDNHGAEPCKLTIFDTELTEVLSHEFRSVDEAADAQVCFPRPDRLVLCSPNGEMTVWERQADTSQWSVLKVLRGLPGGRPSAIYASPDGPAVWLAERSTVWGIDVSSGSTLGAVYFFTGPAAPGYASDTIEAVCSIPNTVLIAVGFSDGHVITTPAPMKGRRAYLSSGEQVDIAGIRKGGGEVDFGRFGDEVDFQKLRERLEEARLQR